MVSINCKGRLVSLDKPLVMGIINTTSDSFYAHSQQPTTEAVLAMAHQMIEEGAAILDIGGQSTRPGSKTLTAQQELQTVLPAIEAIAKQFPQIIISIDTYHSEVADQACKAGASIINDISGGYDPAMWNIAAAHKAVYILMHINGTPMNMHEPKQYHNILTETMDYFIPKMHQCLEAGIKDLIIDIGIGFSKTIEQNYYMLNHLEQFQLLNKPMLVGISRKSFIYKALETTPEHALNGTTALNFLALTKGAKILRVHDVKEAVELTKLYTFL